MQEDRKHFGAVVDTMPPMDVPNETCPCAGCAAWRAKRSRFSAPMQRQVEEFHRQLGQPVGTTIGFGARPGLRARLILEEALETAVGLVGTGDALELLAEAAEKERAKGYKLPDLVEAADGLCDLLYVDFGCGLEMGVDLQPLFDEVHRTNMLKANGPVREDGKLGKPPGWQPPRIREMLDQMIKNRR